MCIIGYSSFVSNTFRFALDGLLKPYSEYRSGSRTLVIWSLHVGTHYSYRYISVGNKLGYGSFYSAVATKFYFLIRVKKTAESGYVFKF